MRSNWKNDMADKENDAYLNPIELMLVDTCEFLGIQRPTNISNLAVRLKEHYTEDTIRRALKHIEDVWDKRHFPMWSDLRKHCESRLEGQRKFEGWQIEIAETLRIPLEKFVTMRYSDMLPRERVILIEKYDIPDVEEHRVMLKGLRNQYRQIINNYTISTQTNKNGSNFNELM